MTAAAEVQAMMPAGAAAVTPSQAELRSEDKVDAGEQRLQTGSSDMEISDGEMPAEGTVPQAVKKMSLVTHEAPTSTEQSDAAGGRSPTSTSDQDSSVKTLSWTLSVTYVAFMLYVQFIVQAGLCSIVYLLTPVVSLLGGAAAWWNLIDTVYEIHERVAILMAIALKGTKLYFYGDFEKARNIQESCIVICNHQVEGDYFVMAAAMEKTGKLSQLRHVMKDSLIWIPYVGSFLVARGSFFINRSNLNWKSFDNNCRRLCEDNVPTCLMIYPEGTTWNNAVDEGRIFEKSRQVAIESGREPFRHLLFPRARGFQRLLSQFRGQIKAVYDLTLVYSSTRDSSGAKKPAPSLTELANGLCQEVHIHLRRIDIKDVPEEENDVREFLVDRFEMKERLLDRFYSTGSLPEKGVQLAAQGRRHLVQSLLIVLLALGLGFTSTGLTWLPYHMLVPAIIGLVHVVHHVYLGR